MHFLHPLQFRYTLGDLKRVLLLGLCDGQAYQQAIRLLDFGRDSDRVNTHLLGRFDYRWYLDAWLQLLAIGNSTGVAVTDSIETLLRDSRSRERERYRRRAATAGPRMQLATVLLIVPAAIVKVPVPRAPFALRFKMPAVSVVLPE